MMEPREPNVFEGSSLDRLVTRRGDEEYLARILRSERTVIVPVRNRRNLTSDAEVPAPVLLPSNRLPADALERATWAFLGTDEEWCYVALDVTEWSEEELRTWLTDTGRWTDLHRVGAILEDRDASILAYARGLLTWHRQHRYCGRCGSSTESATGGHVRRCTGCGSLIFPRTDPAIIVLVAEGSRCLLGRQSEWPPGLYSTFAGFLEPGESLREAVEREVGEEAGVPLTVVEYHSSQPWPFPSSIMIGFTGRTRGHPEPETGDELEDARWFGREEVRELRSAGELQLPPRVSIARRMIEEWLHAG